MEYSRRTSIVKYFLKAEAEEMGFTEIREALAKEGVEQDEINVVVKQIDKRLMKSAELKAEYSKGKNLRRGGFILVLIGVPFAFIALYGFAKAAYFAPGIPAIGFLIFMYGGSMMNRYIDYMDIVKRDIQ